MKPIEIEETTKLIFDNIYKVRIPEYAARSIQYMRTYGNYITGIPDIDRAAPSNWLTTYLPIATMAEYYKEGVTVAVVRTEDLVAIYKSITDHLSAWKRHINTTINLSPPPTQDLVILDEFAAAVFQFARSSMTEEAIKSQFAQSLEDMAMVKHGNFLKPFVPTTTATGRPISSVGFLDKDEESKPTGPDRESYRDYFRIRQVIERPRS